MMLWFYLFALWEGSTTPQNLALVATRSANWTTQEQPDATIKKKKQTNNKNKKQDEENNKNTALELRLL